jgi:hypothetical protein
MTLPIKIKDFINYELYYLINKTDLFKFKQIDTLSYLYKKEINNSTKNGIIMYNENDLIIYKLGYTDDTTRYYINYKQEQIIIINYDNVKNILVDPLYTYVEDDNDYELGIIINFNNILVIFRLLGKLLKDNLNDIKLLEIFHNEADIINNVLNDLNRFNNSQYFKNILLLSDDLLCRVCLLDQPILFGRISEDTLNYNLAQGIIKKDYMIENNRFNFYRYNDSYGDNYVIIIGTMICHIVLHDDIINIVERYIRYYFGMGFSYIKFDKNENLEETYIRFMKLLYYELKHILNIPIKFTELCHIFTDNTKIDINNRYYAGNFNKCVTKLYNNRLDYEKIIKKVLKPHVIDDILNFCIIDYITYK